MRFGRLAETVLRHRRVAAALLLFVFLGAGAGLSRLRIDFSFQSFVGSEDPAFVSLKAFTEAWGNDDGVLLVLVELDGEAEGSLLTPARLQALEDVLADLEDTEAIAVATGLPRLPRSTGAPGVLEMKPVLELAERDPAGLEEEILADERLVPSLVAEGGRAALLFAELAIDSDDILAFFPAVEKVRSVLAAHDAASEELHLIATGIPAVRADLVGAIRTDQVLFGALTMAMMGLLLVLLFRRLHGLLAPGAGALVPTAMLMGVMGWTGEPLGILNQVYVSLIPVIAVADAIHVLSRFHLEVRARLSDEEQERPLSAQVRREAIVAAYDEVGVACLFTSITTAIGFVSLALADMIALRHFGVYAGLGILLAFLTLLLGGPLALSLVERLPPRRLGGGGLEARLALLADAVVARSGRVIIVGLALIATLALVGQNVIVDNRLSDTLGDRHPTSRAGAVVDEKLAGQFAIQLDVKGDPGALHDPEVLAGLHRFERWARERPAVRAVQGPASLFVELNAAFTAAREVPASRELAAQLLFLGDVGDLAARVLKPDAGRGRVTVSIPDLGGREMEALGHELERRARQELEGTGVEVAATGVPYVATRGFNRLTEELFGSLLAAIGLIALILGGLFRSLRVAVLSLIPNLLPLLACLALMAAVGWQMAPTVAVVFTVALGIAVDDTIHMLTRVYEERRHSHDERTILRGAVAHTGRPVLLTTLILSGGFAVNLMSSFPAFRHFGALGVVAFTTALVCDLVLLPALLYRFGRVGRRLMRTPEPVDSTGERSGA